MNPRVPVPADLDTRWLSKTANDGRPFGDAREVIEAATRLIEKELQA